MNDEETSYTHKRVITKALLDQIDDLREKCDLDSLITLRDNHIGMFTKDFIEDDRSSMALLAVYLHDVVDFIVSQKDGEPFENKRNSGKRATLTVDPKIVENAPNTAEEYLEYERKILMEDIKEDYET